MKTQNILLSISILLILILLFLSQSTSKQTIQGIIKSISYDTNRVILQLENQTQIIIFTNKILNLKQGQKITVQGTLEVYKNQTQFIADKITLHNIILLLTKL